MCETPSTEILQLSMNNPIVHALLNYWERGDLTYVEALERIAVALARVNDEQRQQLVAVLERSSAPCVPCRW